VVWSKVSLGPHLRVVVWREGRQCGADLAGFAHEYRLCRRENAQARLMFVDERLGKALAMHMCDDFSSSHRSA